MTTLFASLSAGFVRLRARLAAETTAVTAIEFGLSLPFFMIAASGGLELTNLALVNMRVNQIAMMVADNAGRVRVSIDEGDVNQIMIGAKFVGERMEFAPNARVILSSLEANGRPAPNTGFMIRWQRCFGSKNVVSSFGVEGDGATTAILASGMGPAGQKITPVAGTAVMFVEVVYDYQPLIANTFFGDREISATAAYTVRERANQAITNVNNLAVPTRRLCSSYTDV